jgi:capsular polysaccharide transport system ATP-binding protein
MIIVDNVTKEYEVRREVWRILNGVSFTLHRGERLGILGRNGAGKSTLLKLVTGVIRPTTGMIRREMTVSWPIGQGVGFNSELTGADNCRFIARVYGKPIDEILEFAENFAELGKYLYMPLKTYSSGMRSRLNFGLSLAIDFECIVVDEAIAAGDQRFNLRCLQALMERAQRCALIVVSHQPNILKMYCDTGAVLDSGRLTLYDRLDNGIAAYRALQ